SVAMSVHLQSNRWTNTSPAAARPLARYVCGSDGLTGTSLGRVGVLLLLQPALASSALRKSTAARRVIAGFTYRAPPRAFASQLSFTMIGRPLVAGDRSRTITNRLPSGKTS